MSCPITEPIGHANKHTYTFGYLIGNPHSEYHPDDYTYDNLVCDPCGLSYEYFYPYGDSKYHSNDYIVCNPNFDTNSNSFKYSKSGIRVPC